MSVDALNQLLSPLVIPGSPPGATGIDALFVYLVVALIVGLAWQNERRNPAPPHQHF